MDNMELYNKVREVPKEAQKPIQAGRLKGMTDINPMWRIKTLTEQFGACGIGWYYEITNKWLDTIPESKEVVASVEINLYVKVGDEWSKPISGIGGSKIASMERNGLYVDDEVYKKASTDAISVACKNLGIGADVYWDKDSDKYIDPKEENYEPSANASGKPASTSDTNASTADECKTLRQKIIAYGSEHGMTAQEIAKDYQINNSTPIERLEQVYADLTKADTPQFEAIDETVPWK